MKSSEEDTKIVQGPPYDSASGVTMVRNDVVPGKWGTEIAMYDGSPTDLAVNEKAPNESLTPQVVGVVVFSVVANKKFFSVVPNKNIKLTGISLDDMDQLFLHGGEPGTVVVGRQGSSGSRKVLVEFFGLTLMNAPSVPGICKPSITSGYCHEQTTKDLLDFVSATPNAIGYATLAATPTGDLKDYPNVIQLPINGVPATAANVRVGAYDFVGVEHFYLQPKPSDLANSFYDYLVKQYIPLHQDFILPCSSVPKRFESDC